MTNVDKLLKDLGDLLQEEANEKIKKAMQMFMEVNNNYKAVFLHGSGFSGELNANNLRDHMETLELMDALDDAIWNLEDELENG